MRVGRASRYSSRSYQLSSTGGGAWRHSRVGAGRPDHKAIIVTGSELGPMRQRGAEGAGIVSVASSVLF